MPLKRFRAIAAAGTALLLALSLSAQPATPAPFTLLTREARRPLPVRVMNGQEMFALEDLARLFDLTFREDTLAGGLTVSTKTQTITLTAGQTLASVAGRVVSLPAAPVKEGRSWFLPIDFVSRALAPAMPTRLELRRPSRLIVAGDLRVPRITARLEPLGAMTRVTFDVLPVTPHTVVQEGPRLLVRFEADTLDATLPAPANPDLIQALRVSETPLAIAIELGPRFASFRSADAAGERGAGRIVVDVVAHTTDAPAAPAPPAAPPAPAPEGPPLLDIPPAGAVRTIVVDAGHGGDEQGAHGPQGTLEKDVTLGVARRLKAAIEARLGARVILTREADQTVGLDERAAVANNNKADLFISLHANASPAASASGAEVFYLSLERQGEEARRLAEAERVSMPVFGGGTRDIDVMLWQMAQARYIEQSAAVAALVEEELRRAIPMGPSAIQQGPFRVLVGANMPAVLVELGYLSNTAQEQQLRSSEFPGRAAQALLAAVVRYDASVRTAADSPAVRAATQP